MKIIIKITVLILLMATAVSCTSTPIVAPSGQTAATNGSLGPTETQPLVATETPTVTATSTITSTPTPPPDLELTNVTISPDDYNVVGQEHVLMGRIRNNTNTTMLLFSEKKAFSFNIEMWEYDLHVKYNRDQAYYHSISQYDIEVGSDQKTMNCILYPGEEGVIVFGFNDATMSSTFEQKTTYSGPLGVWYTYQSYYDTKPNIPTGYHNKAENVTFQKKYGGIVFDFDLQLLDKVLYPDFYVDQPTWVMLYDKDGKIIDILYMDMAHYYPGFSKGRLLHVHSPTSDAITDKAYFKAAVPVTSEMADQVDHIEVFSELEEQPICSSYYNK
jgi:hypothetical protein